MRQERILLHWNSITRRSVEHFSKIIHVITLSIKVGTDNYSDEEDYEEGYDSRY